MFGQTFEFHDLAVVGLLIVLEGVLSIDNALVLGLLARRLPHHLQSKALTYGLVGAFVFRLIAIATASYLLHWRIVKLLGGAYLVYVSAKHFFFEQKDETDEKIAVDAEGSAVLVDPKTGREIPPEEAAKELTSRTPVPLNYANPAKGRARFWPTVFVIEMTDIAFAVDSIVAAIGVVGPPPPSAVRHPKLWVVLIGGFLGVVLMRFAAVVFIRLLERFPRFETAAYLLVVVIGAKLVADWGANDALHPHRLDFHDPHTAAFWAFWLLMLASFCVGFIPQRQPDPAD